MGSGSETTIWSLTVFEGDLIAGLIDGLVARWDGSTWQQLGLGIKTNSLFLYNGDLIAGGTFGMGGGIARWDGLIWQPLGSGLWDWYSSRVNAMTQFNGNLIVGGDFEMAGGKAASNIARWDKPDGVAVPQLELNQSSLNFIAESGSTLPALQYFTLINIGEGTLDWSISEQISWLDITPVQGTSNIQEITVSINTTSLVLGTYNGTITVTDSNAIDSPQTIDVSYTISPSFGTTVIVHGLVPTGEFGDNLNNKATWVLPMANAIIDRLGSGRLYRMEDGLLQGDWTPLDQVTPGEQVIAFSWIPESDEPTRGFAEGAADALFAQLVKGANLGLWNLKQLHFIAHSRGTVIAAETIQRLGFYKDDLELISSISTVDTNIHFTTLDAHPWDNEIGGCIADLFSAQDESVNYGCSTIENLPSDKSKAIVPWNNIRYFDNYYQVTCGWPDWSVLNGLSGDQIYGLNPWANVYLDGTLLGEGDNHTKVHSWYYGTIDISCSQTCDDGGGIIFSPSSWYTETGFLGPRNTVGFNRSRNFNIFGYSDFIPINSVAIAEDHNLFLGSIFNGRFSMNNTKIIGVGVGNDPGWSLQGGEGGMDIDGKRLNLRNGKAKAVHNWTYIPTNTTQLALSYQVDNADWFMPRDYFKVFIDDILVNTPIFLNKRYDYGWLYIPISGTEFPGTVRKITLLVENTEQADIDAKVWVDDVHFIINNQDRPEFEDKGTFIVMSPIELRVTDPDGLSVDKDTSFIAGTEYEYYVINEGDTGVILTIPVMKAGIYNLEAIPRANADSNDVYTILGYSNGVLDSLALDIFVKDIPDAGYQYESSCCINSGNVDDIVGSGGPIDVSDLTYLVAYLFQGGTPPPCIKASNVDGIVGTGGPIDVSDLTYLVAYLFQGGPTPPAC